MDVEAAMSAIILAFVLGSALYDVELSPTGRMLHSRAYRWRRLQNWFPMGVAYAAFYMARYNIAAGNVPAVREQLQFSSSFMGWSMSAGSWAYAATAPLTGQITDRIGGKRGLLLACLGAALCNLGLGVLFLSDVSPALERALFVVLYAANVLVQGFGTSAVVKINAAWYAPSERGVFAGVFNVVLSSGYFLALGTGSRIIQALGWAFVFVVPGVALTVMAVVISCCVTDTPADATTSTTDHIAAAVSMSDASDCGYDSNSNTTPTLLTPQQQMRQLLANRTFRCYLVAVGCLAFARDGFFNWCLAYVDAVRSQPLAAADAAVVGGAWTLGGFVGGLLSGVVSDALCRSNRAQPIALFCGLATVALGLLFVSTPTSSVVVLGTLVFSTSVGLLGSFTLLSYTVPSDLPLAIAASAAGVLTAVAYVATGLAGVVIAYVVERGGFGVWMLSLMLASLLAGGCAVVGASVAGDEGHDSTRLQDEGDNDSERTPLRSSSCSQRASIVSLSADYVASPMPQDESVERCNH